MLVRTCKQVFVIYFKLLVYLKVQQTLFLSSNLFLLVRENIDMSQQIKPGYFDRKI